MSDAAIRQAARVLSSGLAVDDFARSLTPEARRALVRAFAVAEGWCWGCVGVAVLAGTARLEPRSLAILRENQGALCGDGFCLACHPHGEVDRCLWSPPRAGRDA